MEVRVMEVRVMKTRLEMLSNQTNFWVGIFAFCIMSNFAITYQLKSVKTAFSLRKHEKWKLLIIFFALLILTTGSNINGLRINTLRFSVGELLVFNGTLFRIVSLLARLNS